MNLILFEHAEESLTLPAGDPRAVHLLTVLRREPGDLFDAGVVNGPRGKGTLVASDAEGMQLSFSWGKPDELPPPDPITLLLGLPRPQTARKMLREVTALGVEAIHFFRPVKGERDYAQSSLWASGEWRRHLIAGAEQAFDTRLPEVTWDRTLEEILQQLPAGHTERVALDVYEAATPFGAEIARLTSQRLVLAVGAERGWSGPERERLRSAGFQLAHLGRRVLRTETAVVAAIGALKAHRDSWT